MSMYVKKLNKMETKHTKEYAKILAEKHQKIYGGYAKDYVAGYMKAIEETAAHEMLEALKDVIDWETFNYIDSDLVKKINNAIKKATNE